MNDDVWQAPGRSADGDQPRPDAVRWPSHPPGGVGGTGGPEPANPYTGPPGAGGPGRPAHHAGPADAAFASSARHREQVLGAEGYTTPRYRNHPVAVTSLVLGIVGIVVPGVFLFAIATGHLALRRLRSSYDGGRGLAVAGLVMGYVMLALWGSILLLTLTTRMTLGV